MRLLASATSFGLLALTAASAEAPATRYYRTSELEVRPGIMTHVEPRYPEAAARRFLSGKVVLQLDIDEKGRVERAQAIRAAPPGYFEASAERAFRAARFTPGLKDGRPVKVRMRLEVEFESPLPPGIGTPRANR